MELSKQNAAPPISSDLLVPNPKLRLREQVREVMRFRHYSVRTEEAYWGWIRQFILFHGKKHPREMGDGQVQQFLAHLAAAREVAVSTQKQALNALVFLYAQVLYRLLGQLGLGVRRCRAREQICGQTDPARELVGDSGKAITQKLMTELTLHSASLR